MDSRLRKSLFFFITGPDLTKSLFVYICYVIYTIYNTFVSLLFDRTMEYY